MNQNISKPWAIVFCALAATLAICLGIMAWSEPSATPPGGNVSAPINTGSIQQTKTGPLGIKINDLEYWISQIGQSLAFFNSDETTGNPKEAKMVIGQDGNVGIGTEVPDKKLVVGGAAQANQFCLNGKCCSTWEECGGGGNDYNNIYADSCGNGAPSKCYIKTDSYGQPVYAQNNCTNVISGVSYLPSYRSYNASVICRDGLLYLSVGESCAPYGGYPCDQGTSCINGVCQAPKCSSDADCFSGACSNGVCCAAGGCGATTQKIVPMGNFNEIMEYGYCQKNNRVLNSGWVCRNGQLRTLLGYWLCEDRPCDEGECLPVAGYPQVKGSCNNKSCVKDTDCPSGSCSYGICCAAGECGWGGTVGMTTQLYGGGSAKILKCVKNGSTFNGAASSSQTTFNGVCRNGMWKTALNGMGCKSFSCDQGLCETDNCVENGCVKNSDCPSGICSNIGAGVCCPAGWCAFQTGCVENGKTANWYHSDGTGSYVVNGVCTNSIMYIRKNGQGCEVIRYPCAPGSACQSNVCQ